MAEKASLDTGLITTTGAPFREAWLEAGSTGTHSHGPEGEHSHGGTAFTLWLDMEQAAVMAAETARALTGLLPDQAEEIARRADALAADLAGLDAAFRDAVASNPQRSVLASHPIYQYFSRAYLPRLEAVLWEPDVHPDPRAWSELDDMLAAAGADLMIWEGEPVEASRADMEERGLAWTVVDPCFSPPEAGDFLTVMEENAARLAAAFR